MKPLYHNHQGYWSRRINDEQRLIYKVEQDKIIIVSCRNHYYYNNTS
ncbi:MAG: type II toxin-antitoxin system YoeB family toxin [Saprospiraceae bacterium]|nr:type II toxin-antitoxin system YoeB family toxin [Saprospiraceae bacterium]MBP6540750.1 type II toxin-antitoxin system YoeB family toxin [Saprospiraceae bacterium]